MWRLWLVTDDSKSALQILSFYHLFRLYTLSAKDRMEGLHVFISPISGQMGHIRPVCKKGRDKDIPKASWTASSVSCWPRWRSSSHLTSPWMSDIPTHVPAEGNWGGRRPTKELIFGPQNWGTGASVKEFGSNTQCCTFSVSFLFIKQKMQTFVHVLWTLKYIIGKFLIRGQGLSRISWKSRSYFTKPTYSSQGVLTLFQHASYL